jgi:LL-diaminopimelate aminotransferase
MQKSKSTQDLYYFAALEAQLAELNRQGIQPIRLDVGSPDLPPPQTVIDTLARDANRRDVHGYQSHRGTPDLRRAWADFYRRNFSVGLDPEREVLPLIGSKEGIYHAIRAWVSPGETVLLPDPGYVTYRRGALSVGARIVAYTLDEENGFLPHLERLSKADLEAAKILWLNYPNNPTGSTITREQLSEVYDFSRQYDMLLCHDAAYTLVTFDGFQAPSLIDVSDGSQGVVEFNSLSKTYNMAGWRCGVAVGDSDALHRLYRLKTDIDSGQFLPIMQAAVEAMRTDPNWVSERNEIYRARRDVVMIGLQEAGLHAHKPKGSIYVWARIPDRWTSREVALKLLEEVAVSITPGDIYGENGEGFIRISLTADEEVLAKAMKRIIDWIK